MKTIYKISIFCFAVLAVAFCAQATHAAQNGSYPSPAQCAGAAWTIGLPDNVTCTGSVSTGGSGYAMENDPQANSVLGGRSRLSPDLTSLNKFCQQYTGDSTSYAVHGSMHNFCSGCDQRVSWWTGSSWSSTVACAGSLNVQLVTCKTGCTTTPTCTSHASQKCVGNAVYWFDSCNNQEGLVQTCTSSQTCQNAQCVNIACSSNSDCGTSGYIDSPFCQSGNVYQNYKTYTCSNPGTASSACSNSTEAKLKQTCASGQTCSGGSCSAVTCNSNSDCGTSGYIGSPFCQGGNVYQDYKTYTCSNPGTVSSTCSNSTEAKLKQTCSSGQICSNGSCTGVTCSSNSDCGTSGYIDSPYCQGNSVYQNYKTYTCNNAGTANSYCSNSTTGQLKYACTGNQTCSGGTCSGQNCTSHSYQQCVGSYLYWYNSCGAQEDSQYCSGGCYNNQCQNYQNITVETRPATNVTYNAATLNGYLYFYNSYQQPYCSNYVWFEYGPTISYGNETTHQVQNYSGLFSQNVNLYTAYGSYYNSANYHFRAVAQLCNGNKVYGNDNVFYSGTQPTSGYLTINTTVKNQTSGNANFSNSIYANPSDTLLFLITIQATGNQDVQNVFLRDSLPANLIYKNQLIVSCSGSYTGSGSCYSGNYGYTDNITSGINLGTVYRGQTVTVSYQAQVAPAQNFSYGTSTLSNNVSATSSGSGYNPVTNASVFVTRTAVYGASTVSTGLTNNFWVDSFFLPLLVTLVGIWMWRAGFFFWIEKWIDNRKKIRRTYKSEKELNSKIAAIKNSR